MNELSGHKSGHCDRISETKSTTLNHPDTAIRALAEEIIGKRFVITETDHPWKGHRGQAVKIEKTLAGYGLVLRLDNGYETFVFSGAHVRRTR